MCFFLRNVLLHGRFVEAVWRQSGILSSAVRLRPDWNIQGTPYHSSAKSASTTIDATTSGNGRMHAASGTVLKTVQPSVLHLDRWIGISLLFWMPLRIFLGSPNYFTAYAATLARRGSTCCHTIRSEVFEEFSLILSRIESGLSMKPSLQIPSEVIAVWRQYAPKLENSTCLFLFGHLMLLDLFHDKTSADRLRQAWCSQTNGVESASPWQLIFCHEFDTAMIQRTPWKAYAADLESLPDSSKLAVTQHQNERQCLLFCLCNRVTESSISPTGQRKTEIISSSIGGWTAAMLLLHGCHDVLSNSKLRRLGRNFYSIRQSILHYCFQSRLVWLFQKRKFYAHIKEHLAVIRIF